MDFRRPLLLAILAAAFLHAGAVPRPFSAGRHAGMLSPAYHFPVAEEQAPLPPGLAGSGWQAQITRWEVEEDRDKTVKGWYANGQLAVQYQMKHQQLHGTWKTWFDNGQPRDEGSFRNNHPHGPWKVWYPNGRVRAEMRYDGLAQASASLALRQKNPKLSFKPISTLALQQPEVFEQALQAGGRLHSWNTEPVHHLPFQGGLLNGMQTEYFSNGLPAERTEFEDGLKHGRWESWSPEGILRSSGHYQHGVKHGAWQQFDARGSLVSLQEFRNGRMVFEKRYAGDTASIPQPH